MEDLPCLVTVQRQLFLRIGDNYFSGRSSNCRWTGDPPDRFEHEGGAIGNIGLARYCDGRCGPDEMGMIMVKMSATALHVEVLQQGHFALRVFRKRECEHLALPGIVPREPCRFQAHL